MSRGRGLTAASFARAALDLITDAFTTHPPRETPAIYDPAATRAHAAIVEAAERIPNDYLTIDTEQAA